MSTVVTLICLGPSFQKMTHHFLLHGSLQPTTLEKKLKPCLMLLILMDYPILIQEVWNYPLCILNFNELMYFCPSLRIVYILGQEKNLTVSDDLTDPVRYLPPPPPTTHTHTHLHEKQLSPKLLEIAVFQAFWSVLVFSNYNTTAMAITTIIL